MNRKWIVLGTALAVVLAFVAGVAVFTNRSNQEVKQAAQINSEALVRPHSPVFGNPAAKVTIVEFFDPSCETCRVFYPIVKGMVNASFGQVRSTSLTEIRPRIETLFRANPLQATRAMLEVFLSLFNCVRISLNPSLAFQKEL